MKRSALTLVELLVVVAIIGVLVALILPAIQAARESSRRSECQSHLHQLATATHSFESTRGHFPPGVEQELFATAPIYRGSSLFVFLLSYLEQSSVGSRWNFENPLDNADDGESSLTATTLSWLLCPSDEFETNPVTQSNQTYALTSYGGNGGTRPYFPLTATMDGIFHTTGGASEPLPNQQPVRVRDVLDGMSQTLLFGERNRHDPNFERFVAKGWAQSLKTWGWWAPAGGRRAIGHVTLGTANAINYQLPFTPETATRADPPVADGEAFVEYADRRVCTFGSKHPGGVNVARADGSVEFMSEQISSLTFQMLGTRASGDLN